MMTQSKSTEAANRQQELQERISAHHQQIEERTGKIERLRDEVAMLEERGDSAENQRGSMAVVEEELRVLQQQLTTLERQADDPTQPIGAQEFVPGGIALVTSDGRVSNNFYTQPGLNDDNIFTQNSAGTQFTLLYGPEHVDGHAWWRVRRSDGKEGWVATDGMRGNPAL